MDFRIRPTQNYVPENSLRVAGQASRVELGHEIRLLVWNIYKAKRASWLEDFSHLIRHQHIVIIQEAIFNSEHDALFENNKTYQWIMARSYRHRRTGMENGVKTGAVVTSSEPVSLFSNHYEPFSRTPKLALSTCYSLAGSKHKLLVLNVHAINFVSLRKYSDQVDQLQQQMSEHTGPIILAGDFNTWNKKRQESFECMALESGLLEAKMDRQRRLQHLNRQLDHVYYRGVDLQEITSLDHITSSDHCPITAVFNQTN